MLLSGNKDVQMGKNIDFIQGKIMNVFTIPDVHNLNFWHNKLSSYFSS